MKRPTSSTPLDTLGNRRSWLLSLAVLPLLMAFQASRPQPGGRAGGEDGYDWKATWPQSERNATSIDLLHGELQGAWKLKELRTDLLTKQRPPEAGYLLVTGDHLSLEIHGGWFVGRQDSTSGNQQGSVSGAMTTGTHRFTLDQWRKMTTRSLIGTRLRSDGQYEFMPPGTSRTYDVAVAGDQLTLKRQDGNTLIFKRLSHGREERDFYGRPITRKKGAKGSDLDFYGRPVKAPDEDDEERDFYGRPIKAPDEDDVERDFYGRPIKRDGDG